MCVSLISVFFFVLCFSRGFVRAAIRREGEECCDIDADDEGDPAECSSGGGDDDDHESAAEDDDAAAQPKPWSLNVFEQQFFFTF